MFRSFRSVGLRTRFVLIGLAVLVPLVAVMLQLAQFERESALESAEQRVRLYASLTAGSQYQFLQQTRIVLTQLANNRQVRAGDDRCDAVLADAVARHEWIAGIKLSRRDGSSMCADRAEVSAISVSDRSYFKAVLAGEPFAITDQISSRAASDLLTSRTAGAPIVVVAVPVGEDDRVQSVLAAAIELRHLADVLPNELTNDSDMVVDVIDGNGILLARHPHEPDLIGRPDPDEPLLNRALRDPSGTSMLLDLTGAARLFAFEKIDTLGWVVAVGISRDAVLGPIDSALRQRLALIAAIVLSSCVIGLIGGEAFVFWPLRSLARTAQALERGDLSARARLSGLSEVGRLEHSLNRMAESLEQRESDLRASRNALEQAVRDTKQANEAKSRFLASMSHEIRTPLSGIVGFNDLLLTQKLKPEQRRFAERIEAAAAAVIAVIDGILDISRIEAGEVEIEQRPFSLPALVDNAISIIRTSAERKGLDLMFEIDPRLPPAVLGDQKRLRQVLLNLLANAVKFTPRGNVSLRVQPARGKDHVRFSVRDSGIGIAEEQHNRLFRRFSQAHDPSSRDYGGSGLGLAISKELAELMGGQLGFTSKPGHGSTFWVDLPLPPTEASVIEPDSAAAEAPRAGRILVADDYEMNREVTSAMLSMAGHHVDVVSDGAQAVQAARRCVYDLILLDIEMRGMNGMLAVRQIRKLGGTAKHVPVVAMTANVLPQQVRAFREAGMDDHLGKPFTRKQLLEKVNVYLSPSRPAEGAVVRLSSMRAPAFDRQALADMTVLLGNERTAAWMAALRSQIEAAMAMTEQRVGRHDIARAAHMLVSQAGSLGFIRLSKLASELEEACTTDADFTGALSRLKKAGQAVVGQIDELQQLTGHPVHRQGGVHLAGVKDK